MRIVVVTVFALGLMAIAASAARAGTTFACVNNSSGTLKIVSSCTVGTNANPCHNNDTCIAIGSGGLSLTVVCETETAPAGGGFNVDALCPNGQVVVTGGYQCTDSDGNLEDINVQENALHFANVTPDGWQVIGTNPGEEDCSLRVCATCNAGGVAP